MPRFLRPLWVQVLVALVLGALVGAVKPSAGAALRPLGEGFVRLVRMLVAPVIFTTVVTGIAKMGDLRKVGRVGLKAIVVFEVFTTLALLAGFAVAALVRPGAGVNADAKALGSLAAAVPEPAGRAHGVVPFLLDVIPKDVVDAFVRGDILQVLLFSLLFGVALAALKADGTLVFQLVAHLSALLLRLVAIVMRLAPLGAFGAMAFTVGSFGVGSLVKLGELVALFYASCLVFTVAVPGLAVRWAGAGFFRFVRYIREEIVVVLGTSSSESALPFLMRKLERLGCSKPVVGLVVPLGTSLDLAGTSLYLALAAAFLAQATNTPLAPAQVLELFGVLLLTSKTAVAVTGGGFLALAATLSVVGSVPMASLALLVGVDRLLSEARAVTNLVANGAAAFTVARWERELDLTRARTVLADVAAVEREEAEAGRVEASAAVPDVAPAPAPHGTSA